MRPLRIGTRDSPLATWQAEHVRAGLAAADIPAELVFIKTEGDRVLDKPLPMIGGKGVFTKALDDALYADEIDLAVHSYKDIPTLLPEGLQVGAILKRADPRDALVAKHGTDFLYDGAPHGIATGSNRRRAQWLRRFPNHSVHDIRGNVQTRLRKLAENDWQAAIFAAAGLHRSDLSDRITQYLDWMLPAPAQGAIAVMTRANPGLPAALGSLHHPETALCTRIERQLLNVLEGGCSAPLGTLATVAGDEVRFRAILVSLDGKEAIEWEGTRLRPEAEDLGRRVAGEMMAKGAQRLMETIERQNAEIHGA